MRVLLFSEDGSGRSRDVLRFLFLRMCRLVAPGSQTQRIEFEDGRRELAAIVQGAQWRSRSGKDHRRRVDLHQGIAIFLAQDRHFVVFHVDGDTTWSNREASAIRRELETEIRRLVRQVIAASRNPTIASQAERLAGKLLEVIPHYSIEAWLYQNTAVALEICQRHHGCSDRERLESWQKDRSLLDEIEKLPETTRLGRQHNLELAQDFTNHLATEVERAGKSFAATVIRLRNCRELVSELRATEM